MRHIRISITAHGVVRVSRPWFVSRIEAERFVRSRQDWIRQHRPSTKTLQHLQQIGKAHRLHFIESVDSACKARIVGQEVRISVPKHLQFDAEEAQTTAKKASIRALKSEAKSLLPQKLHSLAITHGNSYSDVSIKQLKARWGSCNSKKEIVLNCFLMQLPWHLIDYVLCHELAHTKHMSHGENFWAELTRMLPQAKKLKKEIKQYTPYF
jgi:predicted metal-dependent hydrolase